MEGSGRRAEGIAAELQCNDEGLFEPWKVAEREREFKLEWRKSVLIDTAAGSDINCGAIRSEAALQLRLPVGQRYAKRLI